MIIHNEKDALTQAYVTDGILYHSAKWVEDEKG